MLFDFWITFLVVSLTPQEFGCCWLDEWSRPFLIGVFCGQNTSFSEGSETVTGILFSIFFTEFDSTTLSVECDEEFSTGVVSLGLFESFEVVCALTASIPFNCHEGNATFPVCFSSNCCLQVSSENDYRYCFDRKILVNNERF